MLHGARDLRTGCELGRAALEAAARAARSEIVREFPIGSIADCLAAAEALDPLQQEGFVVVDGAFRRVKIKSPRYVILHHLKGEATPRRAIELWQTGETGELLATFPEMTQAISPIQDRLEDLAAQAVADFRRHRGLPDRKAFALAVRDLPWSSVLFRLLGQADPTVDDARAIMRRQSLAALERMLDAQSSG